VSAPGLLSRLAESLFWIGRYVERADDTSRIVDAYLHRLLEDPFENEDLACRSLLAIMGLDAPIGTPIRTADVMDKLGFDAENPSAIVGSLRCANENALGSRDVMSSEMWECLNTTWNELPSRKAQSNRLGPHTFLQAVRERATLFAGLTDSTMNRTDPWRFVVLGRNIERVDMTARLLSVRVTAGGSAPDWPTLLRAAGAEEAFLRTHIGDATPQRIAQFLLLDRLFPRSVLYALRSVEDALADLESSQSRSGMNDPARRIIGQTLSQLEYADLDQLLPQLAEILEQISETCARASIAIAERYFGTVTTVQWESEQG